MLQSAACMISIIVTLALAAAEVNAPHTECPDKIDTSTPDKFKISFVPVSASYYSSSSSFGTIIFKVQF